MKLSTSCSSILIRACTALRKVQAGSLLSTLQMLLWAPPTTTDSIEGLTYSSRQAQHPGSFDILDPNGVVVMNLSVRGRTVRWLVDANANCQDLEGLCEAAGMNLRRGLISTNVLDEKLSSLDSLWVLVHMLEGVQMPHAEQHVLLQQLCELADAHHTLSARWCDDADLLPETYAARCAEQEAVAREIIAIHSPWLRSVKLQSDPRGHPLSIVVANGSDCSVRARLRWGLGDPSARVDWGCGSEADANAERDGQTAGSIPSDEATGVVAASKTRLDPAKLVKKLRVRPSKVAHDVLAVLSQASVDGPTLRISARLEPKLYKRVDDLLRGLGGQWDKSSQAHIFDRDAHSLIAEVVATGHALTPADFEFHQTRAALVATMIDRACIAPGMRVLEPEAGAGAIAMAAAEIVGIDNVTVYELMPANVRVLQSLGFAIEGPSDFLMVAPEPVFEACVLNPPFSGGRDVEHIVHAMRFLKDGGRLVAVASPSVLQSNNALQAEFRALIKAMGGQFEHTEPGMFDGVSESMRAVLVTTDVDSEVLSAWLGLQRPSSDADQDDSSAAPVPTPAFDCVDGNHAAPADFPSPDDCFASVVKTPVKTEPARAVAAQRVAAAVPQLCFE